jgi:hypothetical protein
LADIMGLKKSANNEVAEFIVLRNVDARLQKLRLIEDLLKETFEKGLTLADSLTTRPLEFVISAIANRDKVNYGIVEELGGEGLLQPYSDPPTIREVILDGLMSDILSINANDLRILEMAGRLAEEISSEEATLELKE